MNTGLDACIVVHSILPNGVLFRAVGREARSFVVLLVAGVAR